MKQDTIGGTHPSGRGGVSYPFPSRMKGEGASVHLLWNPGLESGLAKQEEIVHVAQFEPDPFQAGRVHTCSSAARQWRLWRRSVRLPGLPRSPERARAVRTGGGSR